MSSNNSPSTNYYNVGNMNGGGGGGDNYSSSTHVPPEMYDHEIQSRLEEWESKYNNTDRTAKMLEKLRETHTTGVDTLFKLGAQSEQLNSISKLSAEQEEQVKGLGKYKKFQKYMRKGKWNTKEKDKPKPVNHEVNYVKSRHSANSKIYANREAREAEEMENKIYGRTNNPNNDHKGEDDSGNPFINDQQQQPKENVNRNYGKQDIDDDQVGGLSNRMWNKYSGSTDQAMANSKEIGKVTEYDVQDNIFIQQAHWIKQEDQHLDEMSYIISDLKNIALATHAEVQNQGVKMDEIGGSLERGSDFNLKKKSPRKIEKEKKKAAKAEEKRLKQEEKSKRDMEKKMEKDLGKGSSGKPLYVSKYNDKGELIDTTSTDAKKQKNKQSKESTSGNPFL